ncbi:Fic family protein [Pseudoflavonifractor sp. BIOML-A6]|nr:MULTISPECIES: Fic family protein [unclassified Pseudoflavonifractor]KAB4605790.1 Fic family protein [Bacteroides thetaiotaomicron]MTQ96004.1 Fic family protein [Pseudoflavonifractor sp. BIOML-A16]MTR04756.1 Fic family protein [Pseudoflavonifractor sp. BIOML-A15]MTR30996.1 Fic family protein [Pseudoflavonifractor sp. BIOML-A14]MTR71561.1 Fic family protein [Pseudoflavonifractor sp. BIOML-A18]MTS62896.1 Fic family protein [Pseudoflavonifractor sp. BIOML-A5]MTS71510.1 Fic family protein [Pse
MEASLFAKMLSDKCVTNLKKLKYKFPDTDMSEFIELLKASVYKPLPLMDFKGSQSVYMSSVAQVRMNTIKTLMRPQSGGYPYGMKAMEDEIASTLTIENIDFSRDSVRKILKGYAPTDESEDRIYGMKKGLEFISDLNNKITEDNIFTLYQMTIGDFLDSDDKLMPGQYYRHDSVYIMGQVVEHTGLPHQKLNEYMGGLITFINEESDMNDLLKAAVIHFYIGYLHPYFDGNGRMARLLHLWYLVQQGYSSTLFIPFSSYVEKSRKQYYSAYTQVEENEKISGVLDVTSFLVYFIEYVYNHLEAETLPMKTTGQFAKMLEEGNLTQKERDLWNFILSAYGTTEFSTKQLEKDFGDAAYATIRSFVLKLKRIGILQANQYGNRVKYQIKQ